LTTEQHRRVRQRALLALQLEEQRQLVRDLLQRVEVLRLELEQQALNQ
jgi:hypothetical protein